MSFAELWKQAKPKVMGERLPPGEYNAMVVKTEIKQAIEADKSDSVSMELTVIEGECMNQKTWATFGLNEKGMPILKGTLMKIGVNEMAVDDVNSLESLSSLLLENVVGKCVKIKVKENTYNGKQYTNTYIADVIESQNGSSDVGSFDPSEELNF